VPTFKPTDLLFDTAEIDGTWRHDGDEGRLFLRLVHVLDAREINDFETMVSVADGRQVDPSAVVLSTEDVERVFFRLAMKLTRLALPQSQGHWREGELRKHLHETYSCLFRRGYFERNEWPTGIASSHGDNPRSVRDFPSGLPGLGKRR
jgi:hypothetical protein